MRSGSYTRITLLTKKPFVQDFLLFYDVLTVVVKLPGYKLIFHQLQLSMDHHERASGPVPILHLILSLVFILS